MSSEAFEGWGIVELMGHQRTAGRLSERSIAGSNLLQVDIPQDGDAFRTVFYGGSAIYALHPTDEASARAIAEVARVVVDTAKVEIEHLDLVGGRGSGFLPEPEQAGRTIPSPEAVRVASISGPRK